MALQICVLAWGESQRDIEMVIQILEQVCTPIPASFALVYQETILDICSCLYSSCTHCLLPAVLCWLLPAEHLSSFVSDHFLPMQLCAAYRAAGGKTVAVLSCRPKLEMEELFASTIPRSRRYKTRFVFRQVSAHHSALARRPVLLRL